MDDLKYELEDEARGTRIKVIGVGGGGCNAVARMVQEGVVRSVDGHDVAVKADTICLHGDGQRAVASARRLREELQRAGIAIKAFDA